MSGRSIDWVARLDETLDQFRGVPRVYGSTDCCQMVAACVKAMTGDDFLPNFPAYSSQAEAAAIIAGLGGMEGLITSVLGASKHISRANVGDVVAGDWGEGVACGVCLGVYTACMAEDGLKFYPTLGSIAAWKV